MAVAPDSGRATSASPTGASATRPPARPSGASGLAVTSGAGLPAPEQFLDGHAQGVGQGQGDPQGRVGDPGLDGGHGLAGDGGHAGQLLLRQAPGLPGQPQLRAADPAGTGPARAGPASWPRLSWSRPSWSRSSWSRPSWSRPSWSRCSGRAPPAGRRAGAAVGRVLLHGPAWAGRAGPGLGPPHRPAVGPEAGRVEGGHDQPGGLGGGPFGQPAGHLGRRHDQVGLPPGPDGTAPGHGPGEHDSPVGVGAVGDALGMDPGHHALGQFRGPRQLDWHEPTVSDQLSHPPRRGPEHYLIRGAVLEQAAGVDDGQPGGEGLGVGQLVRDQHGRDGALGDQADDQVGQ